MASSSLLRAAPRIVNVGLDGFARDLARAGAGDDLPEFLNQADLESAWSGWLVGEARFCQTPLARAAH